VLANVFVGDFYRWVCKSVIGGNQESDNKLRVSRLVCCNVMVSLLFFGFLWGKLMYCKCFDNERGD
jgi:hypothetical protein